MFSSSSPEHLPPTPNPNPTPQQGLKQPSLCFEYLLPLLGQQFDSPLVAKFRSQFPQYHLEAHPERKTVVFKVGEDHYTVEELLAMMLEHAVCVCVCFCVCVFACVWFGKILSVESNLVGGGRGIDPIS